MTKVVSFVAQKGGSAKSTMTLIMANYMAYKEKKSVVVIDGDFPQYSIYKTRQKESADDSSLPESVWKSHQAVGVPPYNIFCGVADASQASEENKIYPVTDLIDGLVKNGTIDYIFVDLAGTVNSTSFIEIVKRINYIFVPFMEAENLFNSNLETLLMIAFAAKMTSNNIKGVFEFWHKYRPNMSVKVLEELSEKFIPVNDSFKALNIKNGVMMSKIGHSTKAYSPEIWNTVAAQPNSYLSVMPNGLNLGNFIKEFLNLTNE